MTTKSETGHAKNIANFQTLIEFVKGYGSAYNPSKQNLQLTALIALKETADNAIANVLSKSTHYNTKVTERQEAFSNIKSLSTRLINALQATEATTGTIDSAKAYNRKMQGKKAFAPKTPTEPNTPVPRTISTSQQSYDMLIQHLSGIKSVLENEPSYFPNEVELQINTLDAKIADLQSRNIAVANAYTDISNARIERNETIYTGENSIFKTAADVKKYIKSVFGAASPQFALVKGIEFSKPRL